MKNLIKYILPSATFILTISMTSCVGDLNVTPIDPNISTEVTPEGLFNKCYANLAISGNGGTSSGDDNCDIDGIDGGTSGFVRQLWNSNELSTDEAICSWSDDGIQQFDYNTYDASHPMMNGFFARLTTGISYCNQYLASFSNHDAKMTAEIRFVRALEYYFLMDAFGNIPSATTPMTAPVRMTRAEAYNWIEKELLDIEGNLSDPKAKSSSDSGYGLPDKAADWMLLSRLYLNAEVYTGNAQWQKAADYAKKVMDSGYTLNTQGVNGWSAYQMLFMGDNGETSASHEAVFAIKADGLKTTSWASTLFLIASTYDGNMHSNPNSPAATNGTDQNWAGNRARPDLIRKFFTGTVPAVTCKDMPAQAHDDRAIFDGKGRSLDNGDGAKGKFTDGYAVAKFVNFRTDGKGGSDPTFPDADFFLFRVAEAYLTYAEATARLNGGYTTDSGTAAINALRTRAHDANVKSGYSLSDICDEWSREFYFEGLRRPTLIRFNRFGGNNDYYWSYKGGVKAGRAFSADKNIYAIPSAQVKNAITQNPGY